LAEKTQMQHETTAAKPQDIRAPSSLSRAEKAAFKRVVRHMIEAGIEVNSGKTDAICDLVAARSRISVLRAMLDAEVEAKSGFVVDKARILALNTQINATTALAHQVADRLGLDA